LESSKFSFARDAVSLLTRFCRPLQDIVRLYSEGKIQAVRPIKLFTFDLVEDCFRYMKKGPHIGKIVVSQSCQDGKSISTATSPTSVSFLPDASYLLVGGLGGLGKAVSTWIVEHGTRHQVYLSRSAGKSSKDKSFFEELKSQGYQVQVIQGSVSCEKDVQNALKSALCPVQGIFQMFMVLRDQAFLQMTHEEWKTAVEPLVQGTWDLQNEAMELKIALDFFVMFSSLSGILGHIGQSNYAAGNTFLDVFVKFRQIKNLPASVINIGLIENSGYLARNPNIPRKLHATGQYSLREPQLLDALSQATKVTPGLNVDKNIYVNTAQTLIGLWSTIPLSSPQN
jgi:hypothetical protein